MEKPFCMPFFMRSMPWINSGVLIARLYSMVPFTLLVLGGKCPKCWKNGIYAIWCWERTSFSSSFGVFRAIRVLVNGRQSTTQLIL